jgi:invasion protein IalB
MGSLDHVASRAVPSILAIIMLAGLTASPVAPKDTKSLALTYSPWSKFCLRGRRIDDAQICFIGMDARAEGGPYLVAAVLIEREGETKKTLRVTLKPQVKLEHGVRIAIDQGQAIAVPYVQCFANGCMADNEADAGLVAQLKTGQLLIVEAIDAACEPIHYALPLAEFAAAYGGPPVYPKAFDHSGKLPEVRRNPPQQMWTEELLRTTPDCQPK